MATAIATGRGEPTTPMVGFKGGKIRTACGCDDNEDTEYLDSIIGDGTNLNESLVHIGPDEKGVQTIVLNGTLPNATDSEADSSDTSSASSSTTSSSSAATTQRIMESCGIWVIGAMVGATVWSL
ncbi:MAG: hypothetical protein Q9200_000609 [Gallowayella weberi]